MAAIRALETAMEPRGRTLADAPRGASRPGAGPVYAARRTAAMGPGRARWTTVEARLGCSGVAPVMERRGKSPWLRWRSGCPKCLRPSFPASAGESIHPACWARASSRAQRARGQRHQAAVRAWAFTWLRILDMWGQTRPPASEGRSLERLRRKGAPLLACAANNPS
jgi:hypothetical protein